MEFSSQITLGDIFTTLSVALAAAGLFWQRQRERQVLASEVYQRLELASIDLFRFEADHPDSNLALWGDGKPIHRTALEAHVCQVLNLFEMAVRFRQQDVMPHEVFGSWVIWMWTLCTRPAFQNLWPDIRLNYVVKLRSLMDRGVALCRSDPLGDAERKFFGLIAEEFDCDHVRHWHDE